MRDVITVLKSKLAQAQSEEDVLSALDSFQRQLTDDELKEVTGGYTWENECGEKY